MSFMVSTLLLPGQPRATLRAAQETLLLALLLRPLPRRHWSRATAPLDLPTSYVRPVPHDDVYGRAPTPG